MDVCIIGGGAVALALAVQISSSPAFRVSLLTRRAAEWSDRISALIGTDKIVYGGPVSIFGNPIEVIGSAEIIILAVPAFAFREVLIRIAPYVAPTQWLGAVPGSGGFNNHVVELLPQHQRVFGLQRSPYSCTTVRYGAEVSIRGISNEVGVACINRHMEAELDLLFTDGLAIQHRFLSSYHAVNLSPSNTILHSARLVAALAVTSEENARGELLYEHWTDDASKLFIAGAAELKMIGAALGVPESELLSIADRHRVRSCRDLTRVIQTSRTLCTVPLPLSFDASGAFLDPNNRVAVEDIDVNLPVVSRLAKGARVETPTIDYMMACLQEHSRPSRPPQSRARYARISRQRDRS